MKRRPDESELLTFLDEELPPQRQAEIRQQLAADWELRAQLAKLERCVEQFVDATANVGGSDEQLPLDHLWREFTLRLSTTTVRPRWQARLAKLTAWLTFEFRLRQLIGAVAFLLLAVTLSFLIWRSERPVSAQEFLQRSNSAEAVSLRSVSDPVVYRKIQIKRTGDKDSVLWESWNDTQHKQFRSRVADQQGLRFLRASEKTMPALLAELEPILEANHLDPLRPLSPVSFAEWRKTVHAQIETVVAQGSEWKLSTIVRPPYSPNTITEAVLAVRQNDWHAVALHLKVQSDKELYEYELRELAYEVLPLQALTVFVDLPPTPIPLLPPAVAPKELALSTMAATASPSATISLPNAAALQAAEVEALYALHQAKADLGEQIEVVRESNQQVVVRGLVQTSTRKEELLQSLQRIPLVRPQIMTIDEAVQQAQRTAANSSGTDEAVIATNENVVSGTSSAPAVDSFQLRLIEQFGGRKGMDDAEREQVNRKITQFYNAIEADASAASAEAWALRRLQDRLTSISETGVELPPASRQQINEILKNHTARLRQLTQNLQMRLRTTFTALVVEPGHMSLPVMPTRTARVQAAFQTVELVNRLTDALITGKRTESLHTTAKTLLTELARLDAVLQTLEEN